MNTDPLCSLQSNPFQWPSVSEGCLLSVLGMRFIESGPVNGSYDAFFRVKKAKRIDIRFFNETVFFLTFTYLNYDLILLPNSLQLT